jgi:hypothetical protein
LMVTSAYAGNARPMARRIARPMRFIGIDLRGNRIESEKYT